MAEWAQKRFWTAASVGESEQGYSILLDARAIKTPAKAPLIVPTRPMADAIAQEWDAQQDQVDPNTMPVTRAANAAIDKVALQHGEVADMLAAYAGTDLLCYRADGPEDLIARQAAIWDPLLEWAATKFGSPLSVTSGVVPIAQPPESLERLREIVHQFDPFALTAVHDLVSISGSLVIGLAALHKVETAEVLWQASRIDEIWQEEQWGRDEEAADVADSKLRNFTYAMRFYTLLGQTP